MSNDQPRGTTRKICAFFKASVFLVLLAWAGCGVPVAPPEGYNNTSDPTNKSAEYIGAQACQACHATVNEQHSIHGHGHKLKRVQGEPPAYPEEGTRAGVPNPPEGFTWSDVSYVIGGYTRKARFIDNDGYILTTGLEGIATQWNLEFPATGTQPGFVPYEAAAETPKSYDYSCFVCHTTGPSPQDEDAPQFQDNRPGFIGTWKEAGVQCEACHGPGSNHIPDPSQRDIFVDVSASACGKCHTRGEDPNVIQSSGGFISHHEQLPELLASGGHAELACIACHDPHRSTNYDRANAIRTACTSCHSTQNMAIHEGKQFVRGDYVESLTCESCHMPFATKSASAAGEAVVGALGRMGDTRTHIFRIDASPSTFEAMFTADGSAVAKNAQGLAAVTLDFVCLRCHNGIGNAPAFSSISAAADVATGMHVIVRP